MDSDLFRSMYELHRSAYEKDMETFFVPGGYDEKEAEINRRLKIGYQIPNDVCYQTCVFGSGYYVTLMPPVVNNYQI